MHYIHIETKSMVKVSLQLLQPTDTEWIGLLAGWYQDEWHLPVGSTRERLTAISAGPDQFHAVLFVEGLPVATGGVHHHVGLCDKVPRLAAYRHWMALMYTLPAFRNKGLGAAMCRYLQAQGRERGIDTLHLFTDTAEPLYRRLGWQVTERVAAGGRSLAVMRYVTDNDDNIPMLMTL